MLYHTLVYTFLLTSTAAIWLWLKPVALYVLAFAGSSFAFSLVSWDAVPAGGVGFGQPLAPLLVHGMVHVIFGAQAALASWRWDVVLTGGLIALVLDADHIGHYAGLPMSGRGSHAILFFLLAALVLGAMASRGWLGSRMGPALASGLALAAGISHIAVDAFVGRSGFPLFAPLSFQHIDISVAWGFALQFLAIVIVWLAAVMDRRATMWSAPRNTASTR